MNGYGGGYGGGGGWMPPWMRPRGGEFAEAPYPTNAPGMGGPPQMNPGGGGGIGGFLTKNAPLIVGLGGVAADVYGNVREGKARDRELEYSKERDERDREQRAREAEEAQRARLLQILSAGL